MINKKRLFSPLFVVFLAVAGIFSVTSYVSNKEVEETPVVEKAEATTEEGLYTTIIVEDQVGWLFRSLWLDGFSYDESAGYGPTQRNSFVTSYYKNNKDSWGAAEKQSDTICYHFSGTGVNLCAGGTGSTYTYYLPAWITGCSIQVENNGNNVKMGNINSISKSTDFNAYSPGSTRVGSGVGKTITITLKDESGNKGKGAISDGKNYSTEVTVNRRYFTSSGTAKTADTVTNSLYYLPSLGTVPDIGGLTKESSSWYGGTTYAGATSVYSTTNIITSTSDIDVVAKYTESTSTSLNVSSTRVQVEDVTNKGWTGDGVSYAVLDVYDIDFGTSSYSISNIKSGDIECQSYATGSDWIHVEMKKMSGGGEKFYAVFPWYFASFKCKFYATKNGANRYLYQAGSDNFITRTCPRGTNYVFKSDSNRAGWGSDDKRDNFYTDVSDFNTDVGTYTSTFYGVKSGSHMYIDTSNFTDWEGSNAKLAINFCRSNVNLNGAWSATYDNVGRDSASLSTSFCWKVQGSGSTHLYECIVPQYNGQDVYWSTVIGVRDGNNCTSPTFSTSGSDDSKKMWNKTSDQFYGSGYSDWNVITISGYSTGALTRRIVNSMRAEYYGVYFNNTITCSGSGSYTGSWNNVKSEYNQHLSTTVQGIVYSAYEDPSRATELGFAMSKYDYICHKYGVGTYDFIGRGSGVSHSIGWTYGAINNVSPFSIVLGEEGTNLTTLIIIIASSVSLLSITALSVLVIKKRKTKEE